MIIEAYYRNGKIGEQSINLGMYDGYMEQGVFYFSPERDLGNYSYGRFHRENAEIFQKTDDRIKFSVSDFELQRTDGTWSSYSQIQQEMFYGTNAN